MPTVPGTMSGAGVGTEERETGPCCQRAAYCQRDSRVPDSTGSVPVGRKSRQVYTRHNLFTFGRKYWNPHIWGCGASQVSKAALR